MKIAGGICLALIAVGLIKASFDPTPPMTPDELAAKIQRVLPDKPFPAMAFARDSTMHVDYHRCSEAWTSTILDTWGARLRAAGITEVVCTGTGGAKFVRPVR